MQQSNLVNMIFKQDTFHERTIDMIARKLGDVFSKLSDDELSQVEVEIQVQKKLKTMSPKKANEFINKTRKTLIDTFADEIANYRQKHMERICIAASTFLNGIIELESPYKDELRWLMASKNYKISNSIKGDIKLVHYSLSHDTAILPGQKMVIVEPYYASMEEARSILFFRILGEQAEQYRPEIFTLSALDSYVQAMRAEVKIQTDLEPWLLMPFKHNLRVLYKPS